MTISASPLTQETNSGAASTYEKLKKDMEEKLEKEVIKEARKYQ